MDKKIGKREIITRRPDIEPHPPIALIDGLLQSEVAYLDIYDMAGRHNCQIVCKPHEYELWVGILTKKKQEHEDAPDMG